jgi:serine/threonine protein kinase
MGGSSSKYKLGALTDTEVNQHKTKSEKDFSWILTSRSKIPLKEDNFENITGLGKGKYGIVLLSKHLSLSKYVAIKYVSKQLILTNRCVRKIQQEISVLQALDHPFAIKCLGGFTVFLLCPLCLLLFPSFLLDTWLYSNSYGICIWW